MSRSISVTIFSGLFFLTLLLNLSLKAEDGRYAALAEKKAQQAIDRCWHISEADRASGNTSKMRSGALASASCMENHIIMLSKTVLFADDKKVQGEVEDALEKIKNGTGALYWNLNNTHEACSKTLCGTMNYPLHNAQIAREMEGIIRDFYRKIGAFDQYHPYLEKAF